MRRFGALQLVLHIAGAVLLWAVVAAGCMMISSVGTGWPSDAVNLSIRSEVVLMSSLVGAALAAAGATYQAVLRNPLADPYLLGVSCGAALFAYLWQLPALTPLVNALGYGQQALSQQVFAFVGGVVAVSLVLLMSQRRGRLEPVTLLLVGVIVNALIGSVFLLLYNLVNTLPSSEGALSMIVGGIKTLLTREQKLAAAAVAGVGWIVLLALAGDLNTASVSDAEAQALGVRIQRLRWTALIVASLITAASVAVSGPIGFIGLICPHVARLLVGSDQRRVLPLSTALGAALLASADAGSRRLSGMGLPLLPVGVLTSLLGGPFFLLLLVQSRKRAEVGEGR
jgi:iron complex transport system permease protein